MGRLQYIKTVSIYFYIMQKTCRLNSWPIVLWEKNAFDDTEVKHANSEENADIPANWKTAIPGIHYSLHNLLIARQVCQIINLQKSGEKRAQNDSIFIKNAFASCDDIYSSRNWFLIWDPSNLFFTSSDYDQETRWIYNGVTAN